MADEQQQNEKNAKGILDIYQKKIFDAKAVAEYMHNHPEVAVEMTIEMARRNKNGQMTDEEAMKLMFEYEKLELQRKQEQLDSHEGKGKKMRLDFSDGDTITPPTFSSSIKPLKQI
jgi:hypothetical protein